MDTDRLLTEQELAEACAAMPGGSRCADCRIALCQTQDAKTFKAVGEAIWLRGVDVKEDGGGYTAYRLSDKEVEDLRAGKKPKGW